MKYQSSYIIQLQYLGYRYHGWAKQTGLKTVHHMVDKTVQFVLGHDNFRTIGGSRTDAMVSALDYSLQLFTNENIDLNSFLIEYNKNLPADIRALSVKEVSSDFNIIQAAKLKEYLYLFASGEKSHPFGSSLVATFIEELDIQLMREGAKLFEGTHHFKKYCTKPSPQTQFTRTVELSVIEENTFFEASFFPKSSYAFRIQSKGFMRNQVRLMMGQLIELGKHKISLNDLEKSLSEPDDTHLEYIAPASGLMLHKVILDL